MTRNRREGGTSIRVHFARRYIYMAYCSLDAGPPFHDREALLHRNFIPKLRNARANELLNYSLELPPRGDETAGIVLAPGIDIYILERINPKILGVDPVRPINPRLGDDDN